NLASGYGNPNSLGALVRLAVMMMVAFFGSLAGCARSQASIEPPPGSSAAISVCESTPEEQGIDSNVLGRSFREMGGESKGLHSLLVLRNGCLVVEAYWPPFARDKKHYLNSATKAVLSALIGIAIHDGRLHEDDFVASYFPEYSLDDTDPRKQRIRINH